MCKKRPSITHDQRVKFHLENIKETLEIQKQLQSAKDESAKQAYILYRYILPYMFIGLIVMAFFLVVSPK